MLLLLPFSYSVTSLKQPHPWLHGNKHILHCPKPFIEGIRKKSSFPYVFCFVQFTAKEVDYSHCGNKKQTKTKNLVYLKAGENKTGRQKDLHMWGKEKLLRVWFQSNRNFPLKTKEKVAFLHVCLTWKSWLKTTFRWKKTAVHCDRLIGNEWNVWDPSKPTWRDSCGLWETRQLFGNAEVP